MKFPIRSIIFLCFFDWYDIPCSSQEKQPPNFSLRFGAGNNISTQHFFINETALNFPSSGFLNLGISTNIRQRSTNSLYFAFELQEINYYPTVSEKTNLGFVSFLAGKTRKFDFSERFYFKQTNGFSLNSLIQVTSSHSDSTIYSGNPIKNLNFGAFSSIGALFKSKHRKDFNIDYGLSIDLAFKGFQIFSDRNYPGYLRNNHFIQYGVYYNMIYNLK